MRIHVNRKLRTMQRKTWKRAFCMCPGAAAEQHQAWERAFCVPSSSSAVSNIKHGFLVKFLLTSRAFRPGHPPCSARRGDDLGECCVVAISRRDELVIELLRSARHSLVVSPHERALVFGGVCCSVWALTES